MARWRHRVCPFDRALARSVCRPRSRPLTIAVSLPSFWAWLDLGSNKCPASASRCPDQAIGPSRDPSIVRAQMKPIFGPRGQPAIGSLTLLVSVDHHAGFNFAAIKARFRKVRATAAVHAAPSLAAASRPRRPVELTAQNGRAPAVLERWSSRRGSAYHIPPHSPAERFGPLIAPRSFGPGHLNVVGKCMSK